MSIEEAEFNTFPKLLLQHATQRGTRPAIREKRRGIWRTMTWAALAEEALSLAGALASRQLQRGAHVAFLGGNRPRLYAGMCAAQALGAIAVPLFQDCSAEELALALQAVQATHAFAEDQEQVDKLLSILPACPSLHCIIYDQDRGMRHYRQPQLLSYSELLKQGAAAGREAVRAEIARGHGREPAFVLFTAGTDGPSKPVVLSHAALIDRSRAAVQADGLSDADIVLAYLPPAWIGQVQFAFAQPLVSGYSICCPESDETMLADMREIGPTYFLAPPRVLKRLYSQIELRMQGASRFKRGLYGRCMALAQRACALAMAGEKTSGSNPLARAGANLLICGPLRDVMGMSRLRVAYYTGAAIAPQLLAFFRAIGVNLKQSYGSTETGLFVTMQQDHQVRPGTAGSAMRGVELKIGERNEILVRSASLFSNYHGQSQPALDENGWFHTGDAGIVDTEGHLQIVDRIRDIGALADRSMYAPRQLENHLRFSPYIKEAVAFGDGCRTVGMMIDIDAEAVGRWADSRNISYTGHGDLASREEVYGLIGACIAEANAQLAQDPLLNRCQIHRFLILPKELDADDGLLTRLGQVRRHAVARHYGSLLNALHEGRESVELDGGLQASQAQAAAEVKIRTAATFPYTKPGQAAHLPQDAAAGASIREAA